MIKWLLRLGLIASGIFLLACCGLAALLFSGETLVNAVAPPEYPDSELVDQWKSGGPTMIWDRRTYHTFDDVDSVLIFYENHMPGFSEYTHLEGAEVAYGNWICNESKLAHFLGSTFKYEFDDDPDLPCVSVTIFPDSEGRESGTQIRIWFDWPAP